MYLQRSCCPQPGNPCGRGRGRLTRNARGGRSPPLACAVLGGCTLLASNGAHCSGERRRDVAFLKSPDSPLFWRQCTVGWRLPWSSILSG